jgi:hypothetical protein
MLIEFHARLCFITHSISEISGDHKIGERISYSDGTAHDDPNLVRKISKPQRQLP